MKKRFFNTKTLMLIILIVVIFTIEKLIADILIDHPVKISEFEGKEKYYSREYQVHTEIEEDTASFSDGSSDEADEIFGTRKVIVRYFLMENPPSDKAELTETVKNYFDDTGIVEKRLNEEIAKCENDPEIKNWEVKIDVDFFKKTLTFPGKHNYGIDDFESEPILHKYHVVSYILYYSQNGDYEEYYIFPKRK